MISTFHKILLKQEIKNAMGAGGGGGASKCGRDETCVQVCCGKI
jgi:hypothetical protein